MALTRNKLAWAIRRKIARQRGVKLKSVSWKFCYGVAGQRLKDKKVVDDDCPCAADMNDEIF